MTEQEKREKVIKGLEYCSVAADNRDCDLYPIGFEKGCALRLKRDALALLKMQKDTINELYALYDGL